MTNLIQIINTICSGENSRRRPPLRYRSVLIAFAFALVVLSPTVRAVDPPPGGGYPGDNTAVGDDSLFSLVIGTNTGIHNTATGYETLLFDTMAGDQTLFHRMDMVEAGWCVVDPILEAWQRDTRSKIPTYEPGTWGPAEADLLIEHDGRSWRD